MMQEAYSRFIAFLSVKELWIEWRTMAGGAGAAAVISYLAARQLLPSGLQSTYIAIAIGASFFVAIVALCTVYRWRWLART
ncbi:MAG: hypothetical protein VYC34_00060, partial [Planctomycetota bacterium]|nr:hypothetical protein [Planctomycetota bacterium]